MNYVLPYVVSFMSLDYSEPSKFLGFIVFLAWIFVITYRSGHIMMNPVLSVFRWQLYEIKYRHIGGGNELMGFALSKSVIGPGDTVPTGTIQNINIIRR